MRRLLLLALLPGALFADPNKVTYTEHVQPILRARCGSCHNSEQAVGGLDLTRFESLVDGGSSGDVAVPGDPAASRLWLRVTHQERPFMPPSGDKLPQPELKLLRQWIAGGMLLDAKSKPLSAKKTPATVGKLKPQATAGRPQGPPPMPRKLSLEPALHTRRPGSVTALAASPWAPLLAAGARRQVLLLHADSRALLGVLPFAEGRPHVLRFSRDGRLLLAGGGRDAERGKLVVWQVEDGRRVFELDGGRDVVLAADLRGDRAQLALGGPDRRVRVHDAASGELLYELSRHTDWITAVAFSPDGVLLATADRNGGLRVWESDTGREYLELRGHGAAVTALAWRADSNVLASASEDGTLRQWEMNGGRPVRRINAHGGGVQWVDWARDGRLVSAGRDRLVKLWSEEGRLLRQLGGLRDIALRAVFSADGKRIIGGDWRGRLLVWDATTTKPAGALDTNPPPLAARLAAARQAATSLEPRIAQLSAQATAAEQAAEQAAARIGAAQVALAAARAAQQRASVPLARLEELQRRTTAALDAARKAADPPTVAALQPLVARHAQLIAAARQAPALQQARTALAAAQRKLAEAQAGAKEAARRSLLADAALEAARRRMRDTRVTQARWTRELTLARAHAAARDGRATLARATAEQREREAERDLASRALRAAEQRLAAARTALAAATTAAGQAAGSLAAILAEQQRKQAMLSMAHELLKIQQADPAQAAQAKQTIESLGATLRQLEPRLAFARSLVARTATHQAELQRRLVALETALDPARRRLAAAGAAVKSAEAALAAARAEAGRVRQALAALRR